jgi:hypothetical protein
VILAPDGFSWKRQEWDVSANVRPGSNLLRWDGVKGAKTHYWLKQFRVFWVDEAG